MNLPQPEDYIDMHTHGGKPAAGVFIVESLMAHEDKLPGNISGVAYTFGIHPWFLTETNHKQLMSSVKDIVPLPNIVAIGEAGFDKLRGPSPELQRKIFEEQAVIAEALAKPVIIHCVRAWEELLASQKRLRPKSPWLIHGFRGKKELAGQLLSKGMYISFWFDFVMRSESANLIRSLPKNRMFLETDGADTDIREIYGKVAADLDLPIDELKAVMTNNFIDFFQP